MSPSEQRDRQSGKQVLFWLCSSCLHLLQDPLGCCWLFPGCQQLGTVVFHPGRLSTLAFCVAPHIDGVTVLPCHGGTCSYWLWPTDVTYSLALLSTALWLVSTGLTSDARKSLKYREVFLGSLLLVHGTWHSFLENCGFFGAVTLTCHCLWLTALSWRLCLFSPIAHSCSSLLQPVDIAFPVTRQTRWPGSPYIVTSY